MNLQALTMSESDRAARKLGIGGSDANIIGKDDPAALINLWQIKRGEIDDDDLSNILPVQLGSYLEPFNIAWFEKQTGLSVTDQQKKASDWIDTWRMATLDGMVDGAVFEAKYAGGFRKRDDIITGYLPQLHHNMAVMDTRKAYLSVIRGSDWWFEVIEYDDDYGAALFKAEADFWQCVQNGEPPAVIDMPAADIAATRTVDMTGNNEFAFEAQCWLQTKLEAAEHAQSGKTLRGMVPKDAKRAFGHGIEINRDKRGALRIKETNDG